MASAAADELKRYLLRYGLRDCQQCTLPGESPRKLQPVPDVLHQSGGRWQGLPAVTWRCDCGWSKTLPGRVP